MTDPGSSPAPTLLSELDLPFVSFGLGAGDPGRHGRGGSRSRQQLVAEHWLHRTDLGYAMVRHDDILAVLRDERWHSGLAQMSRGRHEELDRFREERQPNILHLEGDDHQRLRHLLGPALTPRAVERLRPMIRQAFSTALEPLLAEGGGEFVGRVCEPYPVRIVAELLGLPPDLEEEFLSLSRSIEVLDMRGVGPNGARAIIDAAQLRDAFTVRLIEQARAKPHPGLLAELIRATDEGELSAAELISLVETVLIAGTESTRSQLACAVSLFSRFDDQYQRLRADPRLVPQAVEEAMRYLGAVRGTARVASEDIVYRDTLFPAGTLVLMSFSAANRDPGAYENPNRFDIDRTNGTPHLTLGHGIHFCLGASLARVELQEALMTMATRVGRIELSGDIQWRPPNADFWGPTRLPVNLEPSTPGAQ